MADEESFYSPTLKPRPARRAKPTEALWSICVSGVTWAAELLFHGESYGWEARTLRDGTFFGSHRFPLREAAIAWAQSERVDVEKGWKE